MVLWFCTFLLHLSYSDGTVRVFTSDPKMYASSEELKVYDELISSSQVPSQLGDLKPEDLSGPEALLNPGTAQKLLIMIIAMKVIGSIS